MAPFLPRLQTVSRLVGGLFPVVSVFLMQLLETSPFVLTNATCGSLFVAFLSVFLQLLEAFFLPRVPGLFCTQHDSPAVPPSALLPLEHRGVAKLEAFSERLCLASGRIQVLGTLLRHKEARSLVFSLVDCCLLRSCSPVVCLSVPVPPIAPRIYVFLANIHQSHIA